MSKKRQSDAVFQSGLTWSKLSTPLFSRSAKKLRRAEIIELSPEKENEDSTVNLTDTADYTIMDATGNIYQPKVIEPEIPRYSICEGGVTIDVTGLISISNDWADKNLKGVEDEMESEENDETLVDKNREVTLVDLVSSTEDGELNDETVVEINTEKQIKPDTNTSAVKRNRLASERDDRNRKRRRSRRGGTLRDAIHRRLEGQSFKRKKEASEWDDRDRKRRRSLRGRIPKGTISRRQSKVSHRITASARRRCAITDRRRSAIKDRRRSGRLLAKRRTKDSNNTVYKLTADNKRDGRRLMFDHRSGTRDASGGSGPTIYEPEEGDKNNTGLRPVVIDGSNVAMAHGKHFFSSRGIKICVEYFKRRGHEEITAFVPQYRQGGQGDTAGGREILNKLFNDDNLVYTPSSYNDDQRKRITPYDDRFIIEYAVSKGGVVVSSDQFRDLKTKPEWRDVINNRRLQPTFIKDTIMFPQDPLGRDGPTLDEMLTM